MKILTNYENYINSPLTQTLTFTRQALNPQPVVASCLCGSSVRMEENLGENRKRELGRVKGKQTDGNRHDKRAGRVPDPAKPLRKPDSRNRNLGKGGGIPVSATL